MALLTPGPLSPPLEPLNWFIGEEEEWGVPSALCLWARSEGSAHGLSQWPEPSGHDKLVETGGYSWTLWLEGNWVWRKAYQPLVQCHYVPFTDGKTVIKRLNNSEVILATSGKKEFEARSMIPEQDFSPWQETPPRYFPWLQTKAGSSSSFIKYGIQKLMLI